MKRVLVLIALIIMSTVAFSQNIVGVGERVTKFEQAETNIQAVILMEDGVDNLVPTKLTILIGDMTPEEIEVVTSWEALLMANLKTKYSCKYKPTYRPKAIFIFKTKTGEIRGDVKGYAKNAYGVEDNISRNFLIVDGVVK